MTFTQFCEAHGLIMGSLIEGRWVRVRTEDKKNKRNGAYKFMGDHGFCQNHATMTQVSTWASDKAQPVVVDAAAIAARRKTERTYRVQAIRSARAFWHQARPLNWPHAYVERKGLSALGCAGLRQHDGLLVIPLMLGGALISVQTITAEGIKRFWPGASVKAGSYAIERPRAAVTAIVEGFATGLAVYQAVRQARVIVCFDAGNIAPVVDRIRPTGSVVIYGDNDWKTKARLGVNPGIDKATNAAEMIGCGVAWPTGIEGSDAADFLKEVGDGAHRKLERQLLAAAKYVEARA